MIYYSFIIIIFFLGLKVFTLSVCKYIDGVLKYLVSIIDKNYERSYFCVKKS